MSIAAVITLPDALIKNSNKEEQKELAEFFEKIVKSSSEASILFNRRR